MAVHHMINDFLVGDGFFSLDISVIKVGSGTVSFINGPKRTVNFTPDMDKIKERGVIKEQFEPKRDPEYNIYVAMITFFDSPQDIILRYKDRIIELIGFRKIIRDEYSNKSLELEEMITKTVNELVNYKHENGY